MPSKSNTPPTQEAFDALAQRCERLEKELDELRLDRVMLRNLMTSTPDNIYFKDRGSRFLKICESNMKYLGLDQAHSIVGKTDFDVFDKEHAQKAFEIEQEIIKTGEPVANLVEREVWPDGRISWVSTTKAPLVDDDGEIIGTFGVSRDITKRVQAEKALEKAAEAIKYERNLLYTIMDLVPDSIYVKDSHRKFVFSNKQHFLSLGLTQREDILGKTDRDYFPPLLSDVYEGDDELVRSGAVNILNKEEFGLDVITGEDVWLSTSKVPVETSEFTGVVGWTRNITELKLSMLRIEEAREEAERANALKNEFLAKMSHEIRTPLNGILGVAELLLDTDLDEGQAGNLELIKDSADLLLTIISDLLDFSLIETGNLTLTKSKFDLHSLVDGVITTVFFDYDHTEVDVTCAIDSNVPQFMVGDPSRLRQILINLIGNAKKFTKTGYIAINVSVVFAEANNLKLLFEIDDSGFGISSDKVEKVFESFTQADGSITRQYGGTGLGLAITKDLVGLMNGDVWAQSPSVRRGLDNRGGSGSTFSFTAEFTTKKSDGKIKRDTSGDSYEVLYVNKSEINRHQFARALSGGVFKVRFAHSLREALQQLDEHSIHAIVLDECYLELPEMSELSTFLLSSSIPSMLMGSRHLLLDVEALYAKGISYFAEKPMRCTGVYTGLQNLVDKKSGEIEVVVNSPRNSFVEALRKQANNKTVLVAEDNVVNQKIAVALLENVGIRPVVANNGKEAVELIKQTEFDLVLMDVQMPVMDGLTATKILRKEPEFNELKLIAVTAQAMSGDQEACLEVGLNDYISKPLTKDKFYKLLYKWLIFR